MELSGIYKNRIRKSNLTYICLVILTAVIFSGCKEKDIDNIVAPFAINDSGDLLLCGVKRDKSSQYYIVPLQQNSHYGPFALKFKGSESCMGATWRSGAGHDELQFITGHSPQKIKRFRVADANVSEISSYKIDPNLWVAIWGSNREILALRVSKFVEGNVSSAYLGFFKDNDQSISISGITVPQYLLWIDHHSFYMTHHEENGETVLSKAQLDIDSMALQTSEVLQQEDDILLARQNLNGSLVYISGHRLFRDNKILALLPEGAGMCPFIDGKIIAFVAKNRRKIYILNDKGEVLGIKHKSRESMFVGLSAANRCVYLTSKDRDKILAYDIVGKSDKVVFDSKDVP